MSLLPPGGLAPGEARHVSQLFVDSLAIEDGAVAKAVRDPGSSETRNLRVKGRVAC